VVLPEDCTQLLAGINTWLRDGTVECLHDANLSLLNLGLLAMEDLAVTSKKHVCAINPQERQIPKVLIGDTLAILSGLSVPAIPRPQIVDNIESYRFATTCHVDGELDRQESTWNGTLLPCRYNAPRAIHEARARLRADGDDTSDVFREMRLV
jgi:hypothetical protein